MNRACGLFLAVDLVVFAQFASAQDLSRYRAYVLETSVASVITASGTQAADIKTLHVRPAKIQELDWRAPYESSEGGRADPVRGAIFSFCDDALYRVVVSYDRARTEGLTNSDIIESLSGVYGEPVPKSATSRPFALPPDTLVLAQWDSRDASLTLQRNAYASEFQLIWISKELSIRARNAIREAVRLDAIEAPRRELERQKKEAVDATAARDKVRTTNKAAFRP
jgi:hypothetical protein